MTPSSPSGSRSLPFDDQVAPASTQVRRSGTWFERTPPAITSFDARPAVAAKDMPGGLPVGSVWFDQLRPSKRHVSSKSRW